MNKNKEQEFELLRNEMVETQLIPRGIFDKRVLEAMRKVPRHRFVTEEERTVAYEDCALPIGEGQTISQPYMVAIMTELLNLQGEEKILEIGTGSGYQAAILGRLAKKVYTIERVDTLAERASALFKNLDYSNVEVLVGDGTLGYEKEAPFDGIIITAGCPEIPRPLIDQLSDGGRLVLPLGDRFHQTLTIVTKQGVEIFTEESIGCVFVPLVGKHGWSENL